MDGFHEERPVIDVIQFQQCSNLTRAIWRNNIDLSNSQRYEKWCTILIVLYNENFHVIDVAIYESSWTKIWRAFHWSARPTRYRWQFIMLVLFSRIHEILLLFDEVSWLKLSILFLLTSWQFKKIGQKRFQCFVLNNNLRWLFYGYI